MRTLFQSPLRVYLCLACLAIWGALSGLRLPVSLFPNSTKPQIGVWMPLGGLTGEQFLRNFGRDLEARLKNAEFDGHEVDRITAGYNGENASYTVEYKWGAPAIEAQREVERVVNAFGARLPKEIRDGIGIWPNGQNSGFFALTFYSPERSLDELYKHLEPILTPRLAKVTEAASAALWNPNRKDVHVELNPEKMALLGLSPRHIASALESALHGLSGGSLTIGLKNLEISMPPAARDIESLSSVPVLTAGGQIMHLNDIARIDFGAPSDSGQIVKTSGVPSLILFAQPRPGGNIKKMSEDILAIVEETAPQLPKDVEYRTLVDPSEFIRSAVNNVFHEVCLAALLAVIVLFLFIGNFRNVMTAAIEIPLSIVMAFILMRWFDINLNLISLGGLALSAGMNVDASVVVMENIFRHFDEHKGPLSARDRLDTVLRAVSEVRFPIIASTIASLVVFLPLAMTQGLASAILSDLAMAVVFSHGLSAFVALVLVPTVRLQMMSAPGASTHSRSPIEASLKKVENGYARALAAFMARPTLRYGTYAALTAGLVILLAFALPRLPREIVGKPDTDWMVLAVNTSGHSTTRQMEGVADDVEHRLLTKQGNRFAYTFTQINDPNNAVILARLHRKQEMNEAWRELEAEFTNTPTLQFFINAWNPSEMRLPDPPTVLLTVRASDAKIRQEAARSLVDHLEEKKMDGMGFWTEPNAGRRESVMLTPAPEQWAALQLDGVGLGPHDIADLARVATIGRRVGEITVNSAVTNVIMRYPEHRVSGVEDLAALPIGVARKIVPLKALARVELRESEPALHREDGRDLIKVMGRLSKEQKHRSSEILRDTERAVREWQSGKERATGASVVVEDADKELNEALRQLAVAVALSIFLIFVTMILQFGDVVNALLVLVAVPLGIIGVIASLLVSGSTLSLNSVLGVILLNGISVANSIILVDFLKRLVDGGARPMQAAIEAARKRMRPILMTSLTTGLGMLPIALGIGEGGRILQPLGIAVIGGLGFSTAMTLFVVPSLQAGYLEWRRKRDWLDLDVGLPAPRSGDGLAATGEAEPLTAASLPRETPASEASH